MSYETSYDTGLKPFNHDKTRGKWSSPMDFFYACLGHAFKVDAVFIMPSVIFQDLGVFGLIPYCIILGICVIPLVFMQSFLGQFSSTGFISVFRIAPIFKGIGYVSLVLNLTNLTYFCVFGAIPLYFLFYSLRPTLPWSCEGAPEWMEVRENTTTVCAHNSTLIEKYYLMEVPSFEFFKSHIKTMDLHQMHHPETTFSWALMLCTILLWIIVGFILTKPIEVIGRFIRYSCLTVVGIMALLLVRFAFLPGVGRAMLHFVDPPGLQYMDTWAFIPSIAMFALGPGWGSILTMASYNNFKTNIYRYSWLLCLAQFGIMIGLGLMAMIIHFYLQRLDPDQIQFYYLHTQWMEFLITPSALTFLEMPHFWTWIFLGMIILGCLNLLIVQLLSVLTSVFDEFEKLRAMKREVTIGIVIFLAMCSIYFCSNIGLTFSEHLSKFSIMTQMVLNLLLILVVLWVYGRERFQKDLDFMTNRSYPTWMVNLVRFITPLFLLISFLFGLFLSTFPISHLAALMLAFVFLITFLPWCLIPGYCIFKLMQTSGMLRIRFRRCVRPTDWYPVDPNDRQRYDEAFSNSEISHQLTTATEE